MRKRFKWIILCGILAVVLFAAFVFWRYSHFFYILGEYVGIDCKKVKLEQVVPDRLQSGTISEWKADERIVWDQSGMLINAAHPLSDDFVPALTSYKDTDVTVNECLAEAYSRLSQAVTEETGSKLFVSSDFRTSKEQQLLYEEDPDTANIPGASEHQTGLCLDVYVKYYAGFGFIKTKAGQFVNSKCWEYGFIIRYPSFGKSQTGMKYEPWHIRYVGEPHAKIIYNNHLTLEEYMDSLEYNTWYQVDQYLISRQDGGEYGELALPESFHDAVISPDNTGSYMVTVRI